MMQVFLLKVNYVVFVGISCCPISNPDGFLTTQKFRGNVGRGSNEGMTHQVLTIGIPAAAQEQEGHSKPMKPKTS
jgi:hypothetical protein